MATESSKTKRYKNIYRQMVHDDLLAAAKSKRMSVTRYAKSIGGDSNTQSRIMGDKTGKTINPTESMLRQIAHDMRDAEVNRHWKDYILPEEKPEPVQMEIDLDQPASPDINRASFMDAWRYPQLAIDAAVSEHMRPQLERWLEKTINGLNNLLFAVDQEHLTIKVQLVKRDDGEDADQ